MADWQDFFEKHRDYTVQASFYECRRDFSMEDLYQAFKSRLLTELVEASRAHGDDDLTTILYRASDS